MASAGTGTSVHLSGEMFMVMAGAKMQHVPYRGSGPAINDLLGGQVQVMFDSMPSMIQHIRAGSVARAGRDFCDTVFPIAGHADRRRNRTGL